MQNHIFSRVTGLELIKCLLAIYRIFQQVPILRGLRWRSFWLLAYHFISFRKNNGQNNGQTFGILRVFLYTIVSSNICWINTVSHSNTKVLIKRPHCRTNALLDHIEFYYTLLIYPKIVVRMPPTIIEVVLTPSITRQNVIILILLSFKVGYCECFLCYGFIIYLRWSNRAMLRIRLMRRKLL